MGVLTGRIGLSPVMVGRSSTLERLRNVVELADVRTTDLPAIALVAGEAGIGKTRLLREMVATLPSDVRVFSMGAEPGSAARHFDVVRQILDERAGPSDRPDEAVLELIGGAAQRSRTALVVEDLHWIDADSVSVLDRLARQQLPNLVIFATYRPSDLRRGAPGGDLVLRLERRNEVEQFRLDRLDRNEVGAMMAAIFGSAVSSAAVEAVTRRSGGVPFVVEELLRCCGPDACSDDIVSAQLPWSLEEAVRQQLADLSPAERVVVDALGVFGQPAGFELLASLTGHDEPELLQLLSGLVARSVIEESRDDRFWFAHALLADAVPNQLLGRERRRLHERCFELLLRLDPEQHAALALHAAGAGRYDEIVPIARIGARASLRRGASFEALRLACEGLAEDATDPELLSVATEAAWRLDFLPEALDHAKAWERAAITTTDRIDAMRLLARLELELSHLQESDASLERLIDVALGLPDTANADRARAEAAVAQLLMLRRDERATAWADQAIDRARAAGDRFVMVQAMVERASTTHRMMDRTAALVELRAAAVAAREIGDGVLLSRALNNSLELIPPLTVEAQAVLAELRQVASLHGVDKLGTRNVVWWEAAAAHAAGDLAAHRLLLEEWSGWAPTSDAKRSRAATLGDLAIEEGRLTDARPLLKEAEGELPRHSHALEATPRLALAALDHDAVAGRLAFDQVMSCAVLHDGWSVLGLVLDSVMHAVALGILPTEIRSRVIHEVLLDHVDRDRIANAVEGVLALAEGRATDSLGHLRVMWADPEVTLARPIEGSLRLVEARAMLACGDREGAGIAAHQAVDALQRWPGWRRDRADALLARLEGTTSRAVGELTARESEVAALIAEGLTNGQLAERLFISPKTAAVHVSNILAKLSLSGRAEIAAWTVRRELPVAG